MYVVCSNYDYDTYIVWCVVHERCFFVRCCLAVGDIFDSFTWLLMMLHIFYSTTNISLRHMLVVLYQAIYMKTIRSRIILISGTLLHSYLLLYRSFLLRSYCCCNMDMFAFPGRCCKSWQSCFSHSLGTENRYKAEKLR